MPTRKDDRSSSTLDGLLSGLEGDGAAGEAGTFTLDRETARRKMRDFQLPDGRFYVLELVQAGVLRGATQVGITIARREVTVDLLDGAPLSRGELEQLWGALFLPSSDAHRASLQRLALALSAAQSLEAKRILVSSGDVTLLLQRGREDELGRAEPAGTGTRITVTHGRLDPQGLVALVTERCRYAEVPVLVNGERVSAGMTLQRAVGVVELAGELTRGCAGFPEEPGDRSQVHLITNGVWIATHAAPASITGFVAAVDASHLRKDLSQADVIRDDTYRQLLSAVGLAHEPALRRVAEAVLGAGVNEAQRPWSYEVLRRALRGYPSLPLVQGSGADPLAAQLAALPLWTTAVGEQVTLNEALATVTQAKRLRYAESPDTPVPNGELVLRLDVPEDRAFFTRLLGSRLERVDPPRRPEEIWTPRLAKCLAGGLALAAAVLIGLLTYLASSRDRLGKAERRARIVEQREAQQLARERRQRESRLRGEPRRNAALVSRDAAPERHVGAPSPAESAPREADLRFPAQLLSVSGIPALKPGASCALTGRFRMDGGKTRTSQVTVECGQTVVYRWTDPIGYGTLIAKACGLVERRDLATGRFDIQLGCQDIGAHAGPRPQLALDTNYERLHLWKSGTSYRAELRVPGLSLPERLPLFSHLPVVPVFGAMTLVGRVTKTGGGAPVPAGVSCEIAVDPHGSKHNCRIRITCDGKLVYGAGTSGYNDCRLGKNGSLEAIDSMKTSADNDPQLTMRLAEGEIHLDDDTPTTWSLAITVLPSTHRSIPGARTPAATSNSGTSPPARR